MYDMTDLVAEALADWSKPAAYAINTDDEDEDETKGTNDWAQLGLHPALVKGVTEHMGIRKTTAVQRLAVPAILSRQHVIATAETGSGKTLAFVLPICNMILDDMRDAHCGVGRPLPPPTRGFAPGIGHFRARTQPQWVTPQTIRCVALSPTREIAIQTQRVVMSVTQDTPITSTVVCGGTKHAAQEAVLRRGVNFVCACPGRLLDVLANGLLEAFCHLRQVVLDEADRMLGLGFAPDVATILSSFRTAEQVLLFSASLPAPVLKVAKQFMPGRVVRVGILDGGGVCRCENIEEAVFQVPELLKLDLLRYLLINTTDMLPNTPGNIARASPDRAATANAAPANAAPTAAPEGGEEGGEKRLGESSPASTAASPTASPQSPSAGPPAAAVDAFEPRPLLTFDIGRDTPRVLRAHTCASAVSAVNEDVPRGAIESEVTPVVGGQCIVFTRTKARANRVCEQLRLHGFSAERIHGNRSQAARVKAMNMFVSGDCQILVATDVAARGIDVYEIPLVVNFDLPATGEEYTHRAGRTGRAGHEGQCWSFVSEMEELTQIQEDLGRSLGGALKQLEHFDFHKEPDFVMTASGHQEEISPAPVKPTPARRSLEPKRNLTRAVKHGPGPGAGPGAAAGGLRRTSYGSGYAEDRYGEGRYADQRYGEGRYAEGRYGGDGRRKPSYEFKKKFNKRSSLENKRGSLDTKRDSLDKGASLDDGPGPDAIHNSQRSGPGPASGIGLSIHQRRLSEGNQEHQQVGNQHFRQRSGYRQRPEEKRLATPPGLQKAKWNQRGNPTEDNPPRRITALGHDRVMHLEEGRSLLSGKVINKNGKEYNLEDFF
ncbi:helicase [Gregarina niphandrodes]|uniref:Helicase n=1 Tax=Gregarina niphandrodes TaxID=110365 RepID=A0A023AZN9_GRENI|nr:helicase [Gregarina niphandrodes]EZG43770.1 helicase [Gregarina niphandrodes]|eukprot:XP_011134618.1 helicase [Gregarina niphandrodes]